ncbi:MAG: DNA polymerase III subunit gamma/tau [Planctomycetes bacterium]|nr:DNA polymerase III subunit gamma/tau [Planctomycetota bacterium]
MSYLVLARKYRPRTFSEVVGQETPMRTLQGAIAERRVGHAYLFCGPRGTGKTTTARILAKALICERGPTAEPCLECAHCRDVESGHDVDVIEFDAASNTGVEDVRMLKETVGFAPMRARFKIYIIDEVHMMSKPAFNALLKTLEEPPPHVKFLFATTEPEKVIETVRSRCQLVRLSLIPEARIAAHLDAVLEREQIHPEPGVTSELARLARGSLRDGLSITDQLIALVGDRPNAADVRRVAPQGGAEQIEALLAQIESSDRAGVLASLPKTEGGEAELCSALLQHLRLGLICHLCAADAALFEPDAELRARLAERAKRLGPERLQIWLEELLHARERIELLPQQARIVLEVVLLDLCRPETTVTFAAIEQRLQALEQRCAQGVPPRPPPAPALQSAPPARTSSLAPPTPVQAPRATPEPVGEARVRSSPPAAPSAQTGLSPTAAAAGIGPERDKILVPPAPPAPRSPIAADPPSAKLPARASGASGNGPVWNALLTELASLRPDLRDALSRRGQLVDTLGARATIQLSRALEHERALLREPVALELLESILSRLLARTIKVIIDDPATRAGGASDDFTRNVAELFSGQIEDHP